MALALTVLGETEITLDEQGIKDLSAEKARGLLFYLAVESDRSHRREFLAEMFWPEKPEGYGRNNLKQTLSQLRTALGDRGAREPFLISSQRDLQFNTNSDFQIDLLEFELLSSQVMGHCHSSEETCDQCKARLEQAAELYQDDFLVDFYLSGSPEFNEWMITRRESSRRLMADILGRLITCYQEIKDYKTGAEYAKRLVDLEPWSESSHRRLMYLLAVSGKRSAALKQFHVCERMLATEFDAKPTPSTISLYEEIKKWNPKDRNHLSIPEGIGEVSTDRQITAIVQEQTSHLKYWVIGSIAISLVILIWFGSTKWVPADFLPFLFNSKTTNTDKPILGISDGPAADQLQDADPPAPEVEKYLLGDDPDLALAAIYDQTRGSEWNRKDGWLGENSPCEWSGITCQDDQIIEIRLPNNNLEGILPSQIGDLRFLQVLDLSNNHLKGAIPPEIGHLKDLESLYLEGNPDISGEIPPEIGSLSNLEELILSSSGGGGSLLSGEIPPQLGQLTRLEKLIIEDSLIQGSIPFQLGNLSRLSVLSLALNNLSGPIPAELYDLIKLRSLDLWANHNLSGTISAKIGQLTKLDFLNLSHNNFSGNLPEELGSLINLNWLGVDNNAFEGDLPTSMTGLNLNVFHFDNTFICKPADSAFQNWFETIDELKSPEDPCHPNPSHDAVFPFSSSENDPYVISPENACLPGERLLYSEDFQDGHAQGWPEIEYRAQNWDIVSDPQNPENLVIQNPGYFDSGSYLGENYFDDAVWRVNYLIRGKPEYIFIWHHKGEPYESEAGTVHSSDYSFAFMFDGTYFHRATHPYPNIELLGIPLSIKKDIWHTIEISTFRGLVEVWLDGQELLSYQDPDPLPGGIMGLGLWTSRSDDSMVYFDNLRVCELTAPFSAGQKNE